MQLVSHFRRRKLVRTGAAAVEMAFVAPVLFLMIFGMIEVGRAIMVQQLLTNAARDGVRAAVLEGSTVPGVQAQVADYLSGSYVNGVTVEVVPDPIETAPGGGPVTVTVSVPFEAVSWLPAAWFLGGQSLTATVTMRREVYTSSSEE